MIFLITKNFGGQLIAELKAGKQNRIKLTCEQMQKIAKCSERFKRCVFLEQETPLRQENEHVIFRKSFLYVHSR